MSAPPDRIEAEACGPRFDRLMMIETRNRTFAAIGKIAARIEPGMTEEEGIAVGRQALREDGLLRGWHGIQIRFGSNTTLTFREKSEPGIVLGTDDIFFVDIGPVWRNCEGDGGATFTTGSDPEMNRIAQDSKAIFDVVAARWRDDGLTGRSLYEVAVAEAAGARLAAEPRVVRPPRLGFPAQGAIRRRPHRPAVRPVAGPLDPRDPAATSRLAPSARSTKIS